MKVVKYAKYVGSMVGRGLPSPMDGTTGEVHPKNEESKWSLQEPR